MQGGTPAREGYDPSQSANQNRRDSQNCQGIMSCCRTLKSEKVAERIELGKFNNAKRDKLEISSSLGIRKRAASRYCCRIASNKSRFAFLLATLSNVTMLCISPHQKVHQNLRNLQIVTNCQVVKSQLATSRSDTQLSTDPTSANPPVSFP